MPLPPKMSEIEIISIPPLKPDEQSLLSRHSLLNVFNVLRGELVMLGLQIANNAELLAPGLGLCDQWIERLRDPVANSEDVRQVDARIAAISRHIDAALAARPEANASTEVLESLANIQSVFAIFRVRARELLAREQNPEQWEKYSIVELHEGIVEIFSAMEKHSHGRFRILYNVARQQTNDYYIDFRVESSAGEHLMMPPVFQDVMRDLLANARKYTPPGGHITAGLYVDRQGLRFLVEDTGCGIPAHELEKVIHFGKRASNVGEVRTMGGGFGLTKAFLVTKQFGGRFWIASRLGVGTRVRIYIPQPAPEPTSKNELQPQPQPAGLPIHESIYPSMHQSTNPPRVNLIS